VPKKEDETEKKKKKSRRDQKRTGHINSAKTIQTSKTKVPVSKPGPNFGGSKTVQQAVNPKKKRMGMRFGKRGRKKQSDASDPVPQ